MAAWHAKWPSVGWYAHSGVLMQQSLFVWHVSSGVLQ
jgi:hypothetical protein